MLPENPRKKNKNRISGDIKRDATGISFLLEKDGEAVEEKKISVSLHENESYIRKRCENCDDILIRPMRLGEGHKVDCLMVYIEVAVSNMMLDDSAIGKMINHFWEIPGETVSELRMWKNFFPWKKSSGRFFPEMRFSLWTVMTGP